jgi:hypothetical protein
MSLWALGCEDARRGRDRRYSHTEGSCNGYTNGYNWGLVRGGGFRVQMRDGTERVFSTEEVHPVRGCFFTWREKNLIYLAAGDDGRWWEMGCFADVVMFDIIDALRNSLNDKWVTGRALDSSN